MGVDMAKQPIKEKLRVDLREKYKNSLFIHYAGKNLSAQHRFCDSNNNLLMYFQEYLIIESCDKGETWDHCLGHRTWDHCVGYRTWPYNNGCEILRAPNGYLMAVHKGMEFRGSSDGGYVWKPTQQIPSVANTHYSQIGRWNYCTTTVTSKGLILIAGDYSLGRPDIDPDVLCVLSSEDWGHSWRTSRLFAPADPLPKAPEGFAEPVIVEMPDNNLWMVFRTCYGELWQCISQDGGITWGTPTPTGLASPISNCYAKRMPGSRAIVLCWNLTKPGTALDFRGPGSIYGPRSNLVFAVSQDNCRTWSCPVVVESQGGEYPTIHFTDEDMYIMYQSAPDEDYHTWAERGLTLVRYDRKEVEALPAWTSKTIQPYIDKGLVAGWLALNCKKDNKEMFD